MSCQKAV
jgi:hypothetical protein